MSGLLESAAIFTHLHGVFGSAGNEWKVTVWPLRVTHLLLGTNKCIQTKGDLRETIGELRK